MSVSSFLACQTWFDSCLTDQEKVVTVLIIDHPRATFWSGARTDLRSVISTQNHLSGLNLGRQHRISKPSKNTAFRPLPVVARSCLRMRGEMFYGSIEAYNISPKYVIHKKIIFFAISQRVLLLALHRYAASRDNPSISLHHKPHYKSSKKGWSRVSKTPQNPSCAIQKSEVRFPTNPSCVAVHVFEPGGCIPRYKTLSWISVDAAVYSPCAQN